MPSIWLPVHSLPAVGTALRIFTFRSPLREGRLRIPEEIPRQEVTVLQESAETFLAGTARQEETIQAAIIPAGIQQEIHQEVLPEADQRLLAVWPERHLADLHRVGIVLGEVLQMVGPLQADLHRLETHRSEATPQEEFLQLARQENHPVEQLPAVKADLAVLQALQVPAHHHRVEALQAAATLRAEEMLIREE